MSSLTLSATVNASPSVSANGSSTNISSASSDSSGGSNSETTVISDGGFTDYLSDESEQELQRQAEVRAELLTQNHFEELEFKKARQQLVQVDLRPPQVVDWLWLRFWLGQRWGECGRRERGQRGECCKRRERGRERIAALTSWR